MKECSLLRGIQKTERPKRIGENKLVDNVPSTLIQLPADLYFRFAIVKGVETIIALNVDL